LPDETDRLPKTVGKLLERPVHFLKQEELAAMEVANTEMRRRGL